MTRNEEITRAAAAIIGKNVDGWLWDNSTMALHEFDENGFDPGQPVGVFAPLAIPADAYKVETTLLVNVDYRKVDAETLNLTFWSTLIANGKGPRYSINAPAADSEGLLAARMRGAVEYASCIHHWRSPTNVLPLFSPSAKAVFACGADHG